MGPFSQALTALKGSVDEVKSINGLPAPAISIQNAVGESLSGILNDGPGFQSDVLAGIEPAIQSLERAIEALQRGVSLEQVTSAIKGVAGTVAKFQGRAAGLNDMAASAVKLISKAFTELSGVEGEIQSQIANLQGQAGAAQGEMEAAQKRYYWLIALGPFGVIGVAAALALYFTWKKKVSELQDRVNSLNAQTRSLQALINCCKALAGANGQALQQLTNLKNAVDTTVSDFTEVTRDLDENVSPAQIELLLRACVGMLSTLQADVS